MSAADPQATRVSLRDHRDAELIAAATGAMLLSLRTGQPSAHPVRDQLGRADRLANDLILRQLAARHPDDAVLSEEAPDSPDRLTAHRVWIVDPLDGTREYTEGRDDWGVQIALAVGGLPIVGAIALPASRRLLSTRAPAPVAYRSRRRTIVVSRSHTPAFARIVAERLDAELLLLGSAAAKTAAVLAGSADIYLHAGGMYEWDSAAPAAVAKAAGLHASRLDGRPLRYNQPDPYLPDLLICRPDLADAVLDAVPGCASP